MIRSAHLSSAAALAFALAIAPTAAPAATVVDFDAQAANSDGLLTGVPDSPLTIGAATFTGGELRNGEIGLIDQSGVYATRGVFGADSNPLHIQFSTPVDNLSLFLYNGEAAQTYTVSDNLGNMLTQSIPSAGAGGSWQVSLSALGITAVDIKSANADGWNFAIDRVAFAETPEPASFALFCLAAFALAFAPLRRLLKRKTAASGLSQDEVRLFR